MKDYKVNKNKMILIISLVVVFVAAATVSAVMAMGEGERKKAARQEQDALTVVSKDKVNKDSGVIETTENGDEANTFDTKSDQTDNTQQQNQPGKTPKVTAVPTKAPSQAPSATATVPEATPDISAYKLSLTVGVFKSGSGTDANVTFSVSLKKNGQSVTELSGANVEFFTSSSMGQNPDLFVGNKALDTSGNASVVIKQDVGSFQGVAKISHPKTRTLSSNVYSYTIPSGVQKPTLSFSVSTGLKFHEVQPFKKPVGPLVDPGTVIIPKFNTVYTAKLLMPDGMELDPAKEIQISFKTAPKANPFYKTTGTVKLVQGVAILRFIQDPGVFKAYAVWSDSPFGKITSNISEYTIYEKPLPLPTIKPPLIDVKPSI